MSRPALSFLGFLAGAALLSAAASGCGVDLHGVFTDGAATGGAQGGGGQGAGTSDTTSSSEGGATTTPPETTSMTTTEMMTTTTTTTTDTPTPTGGPVDCGVSECQVPSQICCWDKYGIGTGDAESGQCVMTPVSPQDCDTTIKPGGVQTVISCQNQDQCPSANVCCGELDQFTGGNGQEFNYYPVVECRPTCEGQQTRIMCKGDGDPICKSGTFCKQSQLLPPGFFVCGT